MNLMKAFDKVAHSKLLDNLDYHDLDNYLDKRVHTHVGQLIALWAQSTGSHE